MITLRILHERRWPPPLVQGAQLVASNPGGRPPDLSGQEREPEG